MKNICISIIVFISSISSMASSYEKTLDKAFDAFVRLEKETQGYQGFKLWRNRFSGKEGLAYLVAFNPPRQIISKMEGTSLREYDYIEDKSSLHSFLQCAEAEEARLWLMPDNKLDDPIILKTTSGLIEELKEKSDEEGLEIDLVFHFQDKFLKREIPQSFVEDLKPLSNLSRAMFFGKSARVDDFSFMTNTQEMKNWLQLEYQSWLPFFKVGGQAEEMVWYVNVDKNSPNFGRYGFFEFLEESSYSIILSADAESTANTLVDKMLLLALEHSSLFSSGTRLKFVKEKIAPLFEPSDITIPIF